MADGKNKQPLSLNQLHNRHLLGLSALQSKPKAHPVTEDGDTHSEMGLDGLSAPAQDYGDVPRFDLGTTPSPPLEVTEDGDTHSEMGLDGLSAPAQDYGDVPRFDLGTTPSPPLKDREERDSFEEPVSKLKDPSPGLLPVMADSDSSSSTIVDMELVHIEQESSKIFDKKDAAAKERSSASGVAILNSSFQGADRQTKVKIEGRRRLCRISKDNDGVAGADKRDKEPECDELCDFDSPLQMNKTCEESGTAIRDILNDLSSRLEILSIEKKRVPKKVEVMDILESVGSKINMIKEDEFPEYETATSSNLLSSDFPEEIVDSEDGSTGTTVISAHRKMNGYAEIKKSNCASKVNKPVHKFEVIDSNKHVRPHVKSRFVKEPQARNVRREEEVSDIDKYMVLSRTPVNNMDMKQGKFIALSDDESVENKTLGNHVDDFTLTGQNGTYRLPGKIATILYPHQREGLKWLWSLHCKGKGGILGDDMGLGKTMQICSYIAGLFHSNLIQRVLVVAPKTLLTHWINELSTVGLSQKTREYFAPCVKTRHYELKYVLQDKGILLTTYDIVRNNTKALCGDYHYNDGGEENVTWDYMFLDEGHLIKNPSTQRAKSLLQIPCYHRIIVSGTPLQNNLKELWALFNFSCPELLGDKKEFKEKYENFINRGNEKNASNREKRIGSSVAQDLRDRIQSYFLRRLKSEIFADDSTLSKKNEIIIWLQLTQCQRRLYEAFLKSELVVSAFDGSPLAAITILKKICDHPLLLTKRAAEDVLEGMDSIDSQEDRRVAEKLALHIADVAERFDIIENHDISCKITFILALLDNLIPEGHNVLIFSQTRKMLNIIQESLDSNHYKYIRIDGTTKASDRAKIVKDFQEGQGGPIFLLTSQVGGLGLTLTNADRVIVVDPAWNPSTDNQSVDRAYRIGQKKDVIVYRLMTCGTVEEKIYRKQVFKGGLFRSATEHKEQIRYFNQQDLRDLFRLPEQGFGISLTQKQLLEEHDNQHTMEESLREHVTFLETLNIAGISQHSLLFSKEPPVQAVEIDVETERLRGSKFVGNASARSSAEQVVDGERYAFNPKDVKKFHGNSNTDAREPSEFEIRQRIHRFSQIIANEAAVSRLPDKGEKIHNQLVALTRQLDQMRMAKGSEKNVIEL